MNLVHQNTGRLLLGLEISEKYLERRKILDESKVMSVSPNINHCYVTLGRGK